MDFMMLRWDGSWCEYNNVSRIDFTTETMLVYECGQVIPFEEQKDSIKEFGVFTPYTEAYFNDNIRYQ